MTTLVGSYLTADNSVTTKLVVMDCCNCGVVFAMAEGLYDERHNKGGSFWCPNGHSQHFTEPETTKLKRLLKNAQSTAEWERRHREQTEHRLRATKGVVTKLRKRALEGECPFCGQHLRDLERHVARQHPNEPVESPEAVPA